MAPKSKPDFQAVAQARVSNAVKAPQVRKANLPAKPKFKSQKISDFPDFAQGKGKGVGAPRSAMGAAKSAARKTKKTKSKGPVNNNPNLMLAARTRLMKGYGKGISVRKMAKRIHKRRARKHAMGIAKGQTRDSSS